jgi:hypothetical protein
VTSPWERKDGEGDRAHGRRPDGAKRAMDALSSVHRYYIRMFDVAKCTKSRGSARYQIRGTKRLLQVGGWYCVGDH